MLLLRAVLLLSVLCLLSADPVRQEVYRFQNASGMCPTDEEGRRARDALTSRTKELLSENTTTTTAVQSECGGQGWRRVAFLDMTDPNQYCPVGLVLTRSPRRMCGRGASNYLTCRSILFSTGGSYSRVCGKIKGCQYRRTYAFYGHFTHGHTIDGSYLDGVSLTHGNPGHREHIWSFVSAVNQIESTSDLFCPTNGAGVPSFVGDDYFCDSGRTITGSESAFTYFTNNPLWDGMGCVDPLGRCQLNTPPLFTKALRGSTTNDIELRLCGYDRQPWGETLITNIELYVHA
jgi:hypothetical protein